MSDVRDPSRDQPLPTPGQQPVQAVLIRALEERRDYGIRKYGRPLETHNGRDALTDAWEEALDLVTYLTQMRLERGDQLPTTALPAPDNRTADDLAAATCSAQYHGAEEVRQCIRAAQHTGAAHTDQNGFHWSDTVAVYPLADGTWRTGPDVRAELRRLAGEAQQDPAPGGEPVCTVAGCGHGELAHAITGCRDCPRGQQAFHLFTLAAVARSGQPEAETRP